MALGSAKSHKISWKISYRKDYSASFLALRLKRITGRKWGWVLISIAVLLMTARRVESLMSFVGGVPLHGGDVAFEIIGLVLSVLLFPGLWGISLIFREMVEASEKLRSANNAPDVLARQQKILLDYSSDFIYRHDQQGHITHASPAVERITGYSTICPECARTLYPKL